MLYLPYRTVVSAKMLGLDDFGLLIPVWSLSDPCGPSLLPLPAVESSGFSLIDHALRAHLAHIYCTSLPNALKTPVAHLNTTHYTIDASMGATSYTTEAHSIHSHPQRVVFIDFDGPRTSIRGGLGNSSSRGHAHDLGFAFCSSFFCKAGPGIFCSSGTTRVLFIWAAMDLHLFTAVDLILCRTRSHRWHRCIGVFGVSTAFLMVILRRQVWRASVSWLSPSFSIALFYKVFFSVALRSPRSFFIYFFLSLFSFSLSVLKVIHAQSFLLPPIFKDLRSLGMQVFVEMQVVNCLICLLRKMTRKTVTSLKQ